MQKTTKSPGVLIALEKILTFTSKYSKTMSVNKVILVGNVGRDPEIKYFDQDTAVANFSLATTERGYKTRSGVEVPERTDWHNIVAWRGLAKLSENYIKKGTQIYVEGKIRTRSYDDQSGQKKYVTEIFADVIQLLGRKSDNPSTSDGVSSSSPNPSQQSYSAPQNSPQPSQGPDLSADENDDDLPF